MDFEGLNFIERLAGLYNMALRRVWGVPRLPAHRIAYRKRIIEKAGCFDENLGVAEDIDFFKRVLNLKPKVGYAEPVQVEASDIHSFKEFANRGLFYGENYLNYMKKHSSPDSLLHMVAPLYCVASIVLAVASIVSPFDLSYGLLSLPPIFCGRYFSGH